ncbi:serine hydrolase domain-containing protein [Agrilutibacter solisilvae]|uniref:Beta-lactamase family protein n=1 Tax=Agrilutibacter solisilvae TaxID=2763317 RepID=A0A974Y0R4_9GAMM|nr:serine hydrolase domain-containing protein [Lysobacter solisilvae]QSX78455.1 beta-lactamase family protein [Lysobacter solisilvae]
MPPSPAQSPTRVSRSGYIERGLSPDIRPLGSAFDIAQFEAMAQQLVADQRVPGLAMAVVHQGRVLSARGFGITDTRAPLPVDGHTVFRLASLSKAFAGTLTGLMVNDGTLRWDTRVTQYVPQFNLADHNAAQQLTVADVLSHRVGLSHNAFDRDLEGNADYVTLTQKLAYAPLKCAPGTCYSYQNIAFSLIGDVVQAAGGLPYGQAVQKRIFRPLGMNDASVGLEGILGSGNWARPHVRTRGGWLPMYPKPTYYRVAPAAGVNASASDMAQWLLAHTGHRPDVLPAPLLATLHQPLVETPTELRGSAWRRERLYGASYALGWRVYDYAGSQLVFHGGAVQGYRGVVALLPDRDLGIALMWNSESSLPSGMLPTMLDRAIGLSGREWLDIDLGNGDDTLFVNTPATNAPPRAHPQEAGTDVIKSTSAPQ